MVLKKLYAKSKSFTYSELMGVAGITNSWPILEAA